MSYENEAGDGTKIDKQVMDLLESRVEECGEYSYALRDTLVDLRHFATEKGLDFHHALGVSYQVYLEERRDDA